MPSSKCQLGLRGSNSTMCPEKTIKRRISSPASALSATLSHLISLGKAIQAIRGVGRDTGNTSPDPNTTPDPEQSDVIGGSATEITPSAHVIMAVIAPWTKPFLAYLNRQELPKDQNEARYIVRRSKAYKVHEGEIYKKNASGVLQRCISEEEGRQLLAEIHAGLGGDHAAARALVRKAFSTGFY